MIIEPWSVRGQDIDRKSNCFRALTGLVTHDHTLLVDSKCLERTYWCRVRLSETYMEYRSFAHFCKEKFLRRLEIRDSKAGRGQTGWQAATPTATLTISPHLIQMKKKLSSLKSKAVTGRMEPYCQRCYQQEPTNKARVSVHGAGFAVAIA